MNEGLRNHAAITCPTCGHKATHQDGCDDACHGAARAGEALLPFTCQRHGGTRDNGYSGCIYCHSERAVPPGFLGSRNPKTERMAFLERKREATKADLLLKFEDADWHGVQDCASDIRDVEAEIKGLSL